MSDVRVRLAPSPTGYMHVGNARTALFNQLFARQSGGTFVWRVEDTDRSRYVESALEDQRESLSWLGLDPDEGPFTGGPFAPYFQSERLPRYQEAARRLLDEGRAYRCFCTAERLAELREARRAAGERTSYDRRCRDLDRAESARRAEAGEPWVLRLRMPLEGSIEVPDLLRGTIAFPAEEQDDLVLLKTDGFPTYHLAVVVDDHAMEISHVLRADEWIPTAPAHVVLYEAFGWAPPVFVHVPMVLNPGGRGKLSKRKTVDEDGKPIEQMTQVREFRAAGYLPEAMINFLSLLGWSYSGDEEIFTPEQAIARFRLEDIQLSPARWDPEKLDWMNGHYIRGLEAEDLAARLQPFFEEAGYDPDLAKITRIAPLIQERLVTLRDGVAWADFFYAEPAVPPLEELIPKKHDAASAAELLATGEACLTDLEAWDAQTIEAALRGLAAEKALKLGPLLQPIRVAVAGRRVAPPLFETLDVLGRETSLRRIAAGRAALEAAAAAGEPAS